MRKLKLYLDTSVISHLFAEDTPDKMADTNKLWIELVEGKYDTYISTVVTAEIQKCGEPKRMQMLEKMASIDYKIIEQTEEITELAHEYVSKGVLREKSIDDCLHIATAVVNDCDLIVSWNFKHLVNFKTISKVRVVNSINNYREISIVSPTMLVEGEE